MNAVAAPWASPGVSLRVQGDDGKDLPVGEIGGIQVKGPNVFRATGACPKDGGRVHERRLLQNRRRGQGR